MPNRGVHHQKVEADVEDSYEHHDLLPDDIIYAVKPTYVHQASKELLQQCLLGATQKANEPYKGLVKSFCPTRREFCGAGTGKQKKKGAMKVRRRGKKA